MTASPVSPAASLGLPPAPTLALVVPLRAPGGNERRRQAEEEERDQRWREIGLIARGASRLERSQSFPLIFEGRGSATATRRCGPDKSRPARGYMGGDGVGGMAVEVVPSTVVAPRGAGVSVAGRILDITE